MMATKKVPLVHQQRRATDSPEDNGTRRRAWYFERRISLDTIVGIAGIAIVIGGPFIVWGRAMEGRVLAIEVRDEARTKAYEDIKTALDKLSGQMTQAQIALGILSAKADTAHK